MIKYQLRCDAEHDFEGWFRSSADYDAQAGDGMLECPACGSSNVAKAIMAPAIVQGGARAGVREKVVEAAARARAYVEKNYDYVGEKFPDEARKIHYGESEERGIYGEASGKDVKALIDEGIRIAPLPASAAKKTDTADKPRPPKKTAKKTLN